MSEQATNSHDAAVDKLETMFGGGEELQPKPAVEGEDQQAAPKEEPQAEATEQAQTQAQPEEVEVEIDGKAYRVPKEISDRFIHHADYTRKTQDLAELRRVMSAERETIGLERAFSQTVATERQQMALLDAQIAQYQNVNWMGIEDTNQLVKMREQLNQLKDQRAGVEKAITAKRGEFEGRIRGLTQEAMAAGLKFVQQHIKGYDEKMQSELLEYGRSEGYTPEELSRVIDPRVVVTLWKAKQWDALKASQPELTKRAAKAAPVVRPGATQRQVSRVQQVKQGIKQAKTTSAKTRAGEDYFTERFR